MTGVLTVLRKETVELLGERHGARGALLQAFVAVVVMGILLPLKEATLFERPGTVLMLFCVFPSMLAAAVAADAFAGERERRTLETLLATPLSDQAVFIGKAFLAVGYATGTALVALGLAMACLRLAHGVVAPSAAPAALACAALGSSALTAAFAVGISSRVSVARSAQQLTTLLSLLIAGVVGALLRASSAGLTWRAVARADCVVFTFACGALLVATRFFRRDHVFEQR